MLRVFEAQFIGYFGYWFTDIEDPLFGYFHQFLLYIFLWGDATFFFDQVPKIIGWLVQLAGAVSNRWYAFFTGFTAAEIIIEQVFKSSRDIFIDMIARNKLAVVKTFTIIQQQFINYGLYGSIPKARKRLEADSPSGQWNTLIFLIWKTYYCYCHNLSSLILPLSVYDLNQKSSMSHPLYTTPLKNASPFSNAFLSYRSKASHLHSDPTLNMKL